MSDLPVYTSLNRLLWDKWTDVHKDSDFYDIPAFKQGASSLKFIEQTELGSVKQKSLLHLQCHFGLDTLSWAREGAWVTGVDFSKKAIDLAQSLSIELGIPAKFILTDIYRLPHHLRTLYDIVFTSYGAICWLQDIKLWAKIVAYYLKPGGTFYMVEFHPLSYTFGGEAEPFKFPYFKTKKPIAYAENETYTGKETDSMISYTWNHSLGEIVSALIEAGLEIEFLHEFPFSTYNCFTFLEPQDIDKWTVKGYQESLPLMFSIRAHKKSRNS